MKKLVLSLVLTLGVSGLALANNGTGDKDKEPVKKEVADKPVDCLVVGVTKFEGICDGDNALFAVGGEFITSHVSTGSECQGTEGGVLFQMHQPIIIDNCKL